jgi:hypothetical protein
VRGVDLKKPEYSVSKANEFVADDTTTTFVWAFTVANKTALKRRLVIMANRFFILS